MAKIQIIYEKQNKGNAGIMLMWESLDGRFQIQYYGRLKDALKHFIHLQSIGRTPHLYRHIERTKNLSRK